MGSVMQLMMAFRIETLIEELEAAFSPFENTLSGGNDVWDTQLAGNILSADFSFTVTS